MSKVTKEMREAGRAVIAKYAHDWNKTYTEQAEEIFIAMTAAQSPDTPPDTAEGELTALRNYRRIMLAHSTVSDSFALEYLSEEDRAALALTED